MRIPYIDWAPNAATQLVVHQAREHLADLRGYDVTLRQLYYRFVQADQLPNQQRSYKRLGSIINNARMAGMLSWTSLIDRTRTHAGDSYGYEPPSPRELLQEVADHYFTDLWKDQPVLPEVWVEKEALIGVVSRAAGRLDVPYFACRGYVSQSAMWRAAQRIQRHVINGQKVVILHLGDHDPSGIDMTRDIIDRLELFLGWEAEALTVNRIALNMDQIEALNAPPNPAKLTDSRARGYIAEFGYESWELDAIHPRDLDTLITDELIALRDQDIYQSNVDEREETRAVIQAAVDSIEG